MACDLRPFRDYDEHDVINLFALDEAAGVDVTKGHFVAFGSANEGWRNAHGDDQGLQNVMLGDVGQGYDNTVSQRYGVSSRVKLADANDTDVLGMLLYDVKETDENGEQLKFNPRKAAENDWAISGQAVPIVTRGIFLYSGSVLAAANGKGGQVLYIDANGELTDSNGGGDIVGMSLGGVDDNNHQLVRINL